jgi:hypothetical protein
MLWEMGWGAAGTLQTGSVHRSSATAMIGADAGAIGERTWSGGGCTAPVALVWQTLLVRAALPRSMADIVCALARCRSKRQSAAQPTAGWAKKNAAKVARARWRRTRGRRSIEGVN